jgi:hypothetical protein
MPSRYHLTSRLQKPIVRQMPAPRWDAVQARAAALKSVANRAKRKAERIASADRPPAPEPNKPLPALDGYSEKRLMRVRKQLDTIDAMLLGETDPQRMDRLAAASARLCEQERQLAGRPLPGSYRPEMPGAGRSIWSQPIGPACGVQPTTSSVPQNQQSAPAPQVAQVPVNKQDSAAGK